MTTDRSLTASETSLAERRPALDVKIPQTASTLVDLVDAIVDDCHPYAIEERPPTRANEDQSVQVRRVHFFSTDDRAAAATAIAAQCGQIGVVSTAVDVVDDGASWAARTQADLRAIHVGRLIVAPPWDLPQASVDSPCVVVHPLMGFGTGHHETTRLCLRALQTQPLPGSHVTDIGTGSGVLGIAAAKLGATSVLAIENDLDAASAARRNIAANDVDAVVTLLPGDIRQLVTRKASCVLANLTGALLTTAPQAIARCAEPGGALVLSGITVEEEAAVVTAFEPLAHVDQRLREGDWIGLVLKTSEAHPHKIV